MGKIKIIPVEERKQPKIYRQYHPCGDSSIYATIMSSAINDIKEESERKEKERINKLGINSIKQLSNRYAVSRIEMKNM